MTALRLLLKTWKGIAHKIATFRARLILSLFYFIVLTPFALHVKIFSDPLQLKRFGGWISPDRTDADPFERNHHAAVLSLHDSGRTGLRHRRRAHKGRARVLESTHSALKSGKQKGIKMKPVPISGADGYIGNILVRELLANEYRVIAFDRFFPRREVFDEFRDKNPLTPVQKDIRDEEASDRTMEMAKADVGDLVVVFQSGAYRLAASPVAFLSHPVPVEVLV